MFITFEGPEGSGKSTQIPLIAKVLEEKGYTVIVTREPGGTVIGNEIRETLLKLKNTEMFPTTEILLFQASRAQLVDEIIRPALAKNSIVLCDRYADSTIAYQGFGHQTAIEPLKLIIDFATGGLKPDLTLLLDIDPEFGLQRREGDKGSWNRLDAKEIDFHQRVRGGYKLIMNEEPNRWQLVDASQSVDDVYEAICKIIFANVSDLKK
jgi:dTMP kinase